MMIVYVFVCRLDLLLNLSGLFVVIPTAVSIVFLMSLKVKYLGTLSIINSNTELITFLLLYESLRYLIS